MRASCLFRTAVALVVLSARVSAQSPASMPGQTIASVVDAHISGLEKPFLAAAAAMPTNLYDFVPSKGTFAGVRSFALQVKHIATANTAFYSALLGRPLPPGISLTGAANGPDTLITKDQILAYLRTSFVLAHEAAATITADNATTRFDATPVPSMSTRLALAIFGVSHGWDHYGQMVEYLRMNDIVPPASQGQPPANPPKPRG